MEGGLRVPLLTFMIQRKRFLRPVLKTWSTDIIATGDTLVLVLEDGSYAGAVVTDVQDRGFWVEWNSSANKIREEDVRGIAQPHFANCEDAPDTGNYILDADGNPILDADGNPIPSV